jgi:hypothetical protein
MQDTTLHRKYLDLYVYALDCNKLQHHNLEQDFN